jgi:hypothetical protein
VVLLLAQEKLINATAPKTIARETIFIFIEFLYGQI